MSWRRLGRRTVLLVGAISLAACTEAGADAVSVSMTNEDRFEPAVVEVPVGGSVTWRNDGARPHTVTAISQDREPTGEFDSGEVTGTGTFSHTFEEPGSYLYQCQLHGHREMIGVVEVEG